MKAVAVLYFFVIAISAGAQNKFEWSEDYKLTIADFMSSGTEVGKGNIYSVQTGSQIDFYYQMSNAEFMMTKNWNEKVRCTFDRGMAYLVAPDDTIATALINFAQFDFDLAELHSRKLRKAIFEQKKWTSGPAIFQPMYEAAFREFQERHVQVAKETDLGRKSDLLRNYHEEVRAQLKELPDFCRTCKPSKPRKKS